MKLHVVIERQAKADLRHAVNWWSDHRSKEQALPWHNGIHEGIETLKDNPKRCGLARENPKSDDELRELHFGLGPRPTHRIIFVIDSDAICVLAVRHTAQGDWEPALR